jgi:hypothetical protein
MLVLSKVLIWYKFLYLGFVMLNGALDMYLGFVVLAACLFGFLLEMHSTSSLLLFLPFFERPTDLMK